MFEILVAEDEELERSAIAAVLQAGEDRFPGGLRVIQAANGIEAFDLWQERYCPDPARPVRDGAPSQSAGTVIPGGAILDIRMPGLDGLELARRLRELDPDLPIVFLSACDSFEYARSALRLGVDEYLLKPASDEEILAAAEGMYRSRRASVPRPANGKAEDPIPGSTLAYLEGEITKSLSEGTLNGRAVEEYLKLRSLPSAPAFVACFTMPPPVQVKMSPGFRKAMLGKVGPRLAAVSADRMPGRFVILGSTGDRQALFLGISCEPHIEAASARLMIRDTIEAVRTLVAGDTGLAMLAGLVFPLELTQANPAVSASAGSASQHVEANDGLSRDPVALAIATATLATTTRPLVIIAQAVQHAPPDTASIQATELLDPGTGRRIVSVALRSMRERLQEDLSLESLAAELKVSPSHLSRLLARHSGRGFSDNLAMIRVAKARELLAAGSSVKEAGGLVGFRDPAYFARVFRKLEGMSPAEYRETASTGPKPQA